MGRQLGLAAEQLLDGRRAQVGQVRRQAVAPAVDHVHPVVDVVLVGRRQGEVLQRCGPGVDLQTLAECAVEQQLVLVVVDRLEDPIDLVCGYDQALEFTRADLAIGRHYRHHVAEQALGVLQVGEAVLGIVQHLQQPDQIAIPVLTECRSGGQVGASALVIMGVDTFAHGCGFCSDLLDQAAQIAAGHRFATKHQASAGGAVNLVAQSFELAALIFQRAQLQQVLGQACRIELRQRLVQVGDCRSRRIELIGAAGVAGEGSPQIGALVLRGVATACVAGIQCLQRLLHGHALQLGTAEQLATQLLAQRLGVLEQAPGTAGIVGRGEVDAFGILLTITVGRVGGPHLRRLGKAAAEDPPLFRRGAGGGGYRAVARVVEDLRQSLDDPRLHGEQIFHRATLVVLVVGETQGAIPGIVSRLQLVQGMHQFVTAGQRDGHQVGLELHLPRQRALRQYHQTKNGVEQRADRPDDQRQAPADPGDTQVDARDERQQLVQCIALGNHLGGDLLGDVDPAADRHRALGEVAELVGQHGLELAQGQHVDQRQTDLQVLARGKQQVQQGQVVEHRRIHPGGEEHPVRSWCSGLIGQLVEEGEQLRLIGFADLVLVGGTATVDEEQRLDHEDA